MENQIKIELKENRVQTIDVVKKNVSEINYSKTETELKIHHLNENSERDNFSKLPMKNQNQNQNN